MKRFLSDYGNVLVLLLLCLVISLVTIEEQSSTSSSAARELAVEVASGNPEGARVMVMVRSGEGSARFAKVMEEELSGEGLQVVGAIVGTPVDADSWFRKEELAAIVTGEHMAVFTSDNYLSLHPQTKPWPRPRPTARKPTSGPIF